MFSIAENFLFLKILFPQKKEPGNADIMIEFLFTAARDPELYKPML